MRDAMLLVLRSPVLGYWESPGTKLRGSELVRRTHRMGLMCRAFLTSVTWVTQRP